MTDRRKKRRRTRDIQKLEYLDNKQSFLDEIKRIFPNFLRAVIWWEKKGKKVDTRFNCNR